jgi:hypothetical protein
MCATLTSAFDASRAFDLNSFTMNGTMTEEATQRSRVIPSMQMLALWLG